MWSEHCSYKSSKRWLKRLPTEAPWVICGPGENAGVVDIGDGMAAVFKIESHNHPSYIEPYQGAATGVGGILRDVFTMGARPVAILELAALRRARAPQDPASGRRRGRRHRRLRQLRRRAHGRRRGDLSPRLRRQHPGQRDVRRPRAEGPDLLRARRRARQSGGLRRVQDRPRRHPRRDHGVRRVLRGGRGQAPDRAGRRSVHREAAARGLPRADADRCDRRDPGHGRGRADLVVVRDGGPRRRRDRARSRPRAHARGRHDALRDHAVGESGADAPGPAPGRRGQRARDLRQVGPRLRHRRAGDRDRRDGAALCRSGSGAGADRGGQRSLAGLSSGPGSRRPRLCRSRPATCRRRWITRAR